MCVHHDLTEKCLWITLAYAIFCSNEAKQVDVLKAPLQAIRNRLFTTMLSVMSLERTKWAKVNIFQKQIRIWMKWYGVWRGVKKFEVLWAYLAKSSFEFRQVLFAVSGIKSLKTLWEWPIGRLPSATRTTTGLFFSANPVCLFEQRHIKFLWVI